MPRWTDEARAAQRARMLELKPWLKACGPKTEEGRKTASRNAFKHGMETALIKEIITLMRALK